MLANKTFDVFVFTAAILHFPPINKCQYFLSHFQSIVEKVGQSEKNAIW